jgi:hypothetical protein
MTMQTDSAFDVAAAQSFLTAQRSARGCTRGHSRDLGTIRNERIKLGSGFLNAIGLTLIAFALLRPVTQDLSELTPLSFFWVGFGIALHVGAHAMLGRLSDPDHDARD